MFPTIAEYNQAIQKHGGSAFRSLNNLSFIPSRTVPVKIYSYGAGSYAVVFKAKNSYNEFAIRCFISAEQENIDRYRSISNYLKEINATWVTETELLENEISIGGQLYPVIKMDWVEGNLLNNHITQILHSNTAITELQEEIVRVSKSLETHKVGHGDIQCGNVIVSKDSNGRSIIKLIDYDGIYIPSFSHKVSLERGRAEFQHPKRSHVQYNERIDRFSFWVILCGLEALKYDKSLWQESMQGGFNTLDNVLFVGEDFRAFNSSKLVNRLYALNKPSLSFYLDKLNQFCSSSATSIESPTLFGSVGREPAADQLDEDWSGSNDTDVEIITTPTGAAVLTSTLQRIGTTPMKIGKLKYLDKTLVVSYRGHSKQIEVLQHSAVIDITFPEENRMEAPRLETPKQAQSQAPKIPIQGTSTPSPDSLANPSPKAVAATPKISSSEWVFFSLIGLIVIIFLVSIASPGDSTSDSSADDTYNETSASYSSTYEEYINSATNINFSPTSTTDDDGFTAERVVYHFLWALNNGDCTAAWNVTYIPHWEAKGKEWFCSTEAYGGVIRTQIIESYSVRQSSREKVLYVNYYAEDPSNSNLCIKQNITVEKLDFNDGKTQWMITNVENVETPFECEFTE